ncbi:MAG: hypothetical protein ABFS02_00355, partial [Pseudomonadota bacterium]
MIILPKTGGVMFYPKKALYVLMFDLLAVPFAAPSTGVFGAHNLKPGVVHSGLVVQPPCIDGVRATLKRQGKARSAGNGKPLPRIATRHWRFRVAPFGRDDKRPS